MITFTAVTTTLPTTTTSPVTSPPCSKCTLCSGTVYLTVQEIYLYPEKVAEIKKNITRELAVNRTELSSTKRKLTSASDNRPSATLVGYIGVVIMVGIFSVFLLLDLLSLLMPRKIRGKKDILTITGKP